MTNTLTPPMTKPVKIPKVKKALSLDDENTGSTVEEYESIIVTLLMNVKLVKGLQHEASRRSCTLKILITEVMDGWMADQRCARGEHDHIVGGTL